MRPQQLLVSVLAVVPVFAFVSAPATAGAPVGEFDVLVTEDFPTSTVIAKSTTPCPPVADPGGSAQYVAEVTNAPDVPLSFAGGAWQTRVDFRRFGTDTFRLDAVCVLHHDGARTTQLAYEPQTVSVALGPVPLPPQPPSAPAPIVPGRRASPVEPHCFMAGALSRWCDCYPAAAKIRPMLSSEKNSAGDVTPALTWANPSIASWLP